MTANSACPRSMCSEHGQLRHGGRSAAASRIRWRSNSPEAVPRSAAGRKRLPVERLIFWSIRGFHGQSGQRPLRRAITSVVWTGFVEREPPGLCASAGEPFRHRLGATRIPRARAWGFPTGGTASGRPTRLPIVRSRGWHAQQPGMFATQVTSPAHTTPLGSRGP